MKPKKRTPWTPIAPSQTRGPKEDIELLVNEFFMLVASNEKMAMEYGAFQVFMSQKRDQLITKHAEVVGMDVVDRHLIETPVALFRMFRDYLPKEGMDFFKSKKGAEWFARKFHEFRVPYLV